MRAIRRARLFGLLVFAVFATLLAGWYVTFRGERERYFIARNFRILTMAATQVDSAITAQERMFNTLLLSGRPTWFTEAEGSVPSLDFVDTERLPEPVPPRQPKAKLTSESHVAMDGRITWLTLSFAVRGEPAIKRTVRLDLGRILEPIVGPALSEQGFGTLVLATIDGRVLHAVGERSAELLTTRLDSLEPVRRRRFAIGSDSQESTEARGFGEIARTASLADVVVSGTEYKLFTQPCCLGTRGEVPAGESAAGLVIVGLVNARDFDSRTREFSPTVVIVCIALMLMALSAWPFIKIRLIGERQRASRRDVMAVVGCGIFAIALLTTVFLDLYAYERLSGARDDQLKRFASALSAGVEREVRAAYEQLTCLQSVARRPDVQALRPTSIAIFEKLPGCGASSPDVARPAPAIEPPYPFFETFALLDRGGMQRVKWTPQGWLPAPIDVSGRAYFTEVRSGRAWRDPEVCVSPQASQTPNGCVLESIWSWTTARPQAVVSMPTGDPSSPVAALSIPMASLIDPVIPEGFEFAIIDDDGLVHFHSDKQRNLYENLFQETDQNRRLRAAVAGHSQETLDLRYAGRSYRAAVGRLGLGNWSVVTLSSHEPIWALHMEWLAISLTALVGYTLVLAGLLAVCLWMREADWLWSDSRQIHRYRRLSMVVLALLFGGCLALPLVSGGLLMLLAFTLPLAGWLTVFLVLRKPPAERLPNGDAHAEYVSLAVLLFLLTGVIPAAGAFNAAYTFQVRTWVKHTQLELARDYRGRKDRINREYEQLAGIRPETIARRATDEHGYDMYYQFAFGSALNPDAGARRRPLPAWLAGLTMSADDVLTRMIEEHLPYFSERSVQLRELLHDSADDGAWEWVGTPPLLELRLRGADDQEGVRVNSSAPGLLQPMFDEEQSALGVWVVLAGLALASLAWAIVRFIKGHICLAGIDQPMWSKVKFAASSGDNLFVVCNPVNRAALAEGAVVLSLHDIAGSPTPDQAWVLMLKALDREEPGRPVLLADFGERLEDPELTRRKLAWVEELAHDQTRSVIVLSEANPSMLDHALRMRLRDETSGDPLLLQRWRAVLASFVVINWRGLEQGFGHPPESRPRSFADRLASLRGWWRQLLADVRRRTLWARLAGVLSSRRDRSARGVLRDEARADAFVRAICQSIEARLEDGSLRLLPEQLLDEVAERTTAWYRRLWKACTPDEQLVLAEIASEGFVNYKSRRTVRRLLGRGLIAKDPSFRLMNETFRRFVLSPDCRADVRAIEGAAEPSPWDEVRTPFLVVLGGGILFFMFTQRELFSATLAALAAIAGAMPIIVRAVGMVAGRRIEGSDAQKI